MRLLLLMILLTILGLGEAVVVLRNMRPVPETASLERTVSPLPASNDFSGDIGTITI